MYLAESVIGIYYWGPICGIPLLWIATFLWFRKRIKKLYLLLILVAVPIYVIALLRITEASAMDWAAQLAVPSIQEAIDTQCSTAKIPVVAADFSWTLDFGYYYSGVAARCSFDYASNSWICTCN
jgi:hypothetical protein